MEKFPRKITYYLAVYQAEEGGAWTTFADFDCLCDQGETVEDAIHQSEIFLDAVVERMVENNEPFPEPSSIVDFKAKLDPADGEPLCVVPITVYPPAKTTRVNITAKGNDLEKIGDYAKRHHLTRSELMVRATLDYIRANA